MGKLPVPTRAKKKGSAQIGSIRDRLFYTYNIMEDRDVKLKRKINLEPISAANSDLLHKEISDACTRTRALAI